MAIKLKLEFDCLMVLKVSCCNMIGSFVQPGTIQFGQHFRENYGHLLHIVVKKYRVSASYDLSYQNYANFRIAEILSFMAELTVSLSIAMCMFYGRVDSQFYLSQCVYLQWQI